MPADFAFKWFVLYYTILGCILFISGIGLMVKRNACFRYLSAQVEFEQPPALLKSMVRYIFLFTLPCLVLSFFPFSWPELLFSFWSLIIVYIAGIQLVRWPDRRKTIKIHPDKVRTFIMITAATMLAVSPVMFLLAYMLIQKITR